MVKFLDLQKINANYSDDFHGVLSRILDSGWFVMGSMLENFETAFANYCGAKHCVGVANGLDALILVLEAWQELGYLQQGDEVIVPANTYVASVLAIYRAGLVPVLVEPDEATLLIDPKSVEKAITAKTRVILPVHLYGRICEMETLSNIATQHGLLILEDSAQSHGGLYQNKRCGALGNASAFSFYPGKNLGALGDGGAITTNDDKLADVLRALRNYGSELKYFNKYKGINSRLDELQAGFLHAKLPDLDKDNAHRRAIATRYLDEIVSPSVILPARPEDDHSHVWHLFTIRVQERSSFQSFLVENGIQTVIHYPIPPHMQHGYPELHNYRLPLTEVIHDQIISLPISNIMTDEEISEVINVVNSYQGR